MTGFVNVSVVTCFLNCVAVHYDLFLILILRFYPVSEFSLHFQRWTFPTKGHRLRTLWLCKARSNPILNTNLFSTIRKSALGSDIWEACADERLNDIVGSAYYVAPEVLHRSYGTEADMWSIGVIAYILLCGSRPFWSRTESGIFRAVLKADPSFDEAPWPSLSLDAIDFVQRLLNKDYRKRLTASQALSKSP